MSPIDELVPVLKKLRLSGVLSTLELRRDQAVQDDSSYEEFLLRLVTDEMERRDSKVLMLRLRKANFENRKTLDDFDFHFNPSVPKNKVIDLATCGFIREHRNVLLAGKSGVGKSHIAQALGHRACLQGHKVIYVSANDMMQQLRAARGDGSYDRRLLKFTTPDLLIIDDIGLHPLKHEAPLDLYEIIRQRYQRGAIILTSNRDLAEVGELFGDALLASAAMDRLLDDAHIITIEGDSFRNPPKNKRDAKKKAAKKAKEKTQ
jgi:DNA replication protein DnaC